jgi:hypothetical protein
MKLKEPGNLAFAILLSAPFMLLNLGITAGILKLVAPSSLSQLSASFSSIFATSITLELNLLEIVLWILGLTLMMVVHEFLHLAFIPDFLRSEKTGLGIFYAGAYVVTEEMLTRQRFAIISISPFIILSVLLPVVLGVTGILSQGLILLALLNAMGSSVDLLGLLLVALQVPRGSRMICSGFNTFWKA